MSERGDSAGGRELQVLSQRAQRTLILPLVLGALAYGGLLFYGDIGAVGAMTTQLPLTALGLGTALCVGNFVVRWARWHFYLRLLQLEVALEESVLVFLSGFAMAVTPGKVGDVLKSLLLKQSHDIPISRSAAIILAERVTDLVALLLVAAAGCAVLPGGWVFSVAGVAAALSVALLCTWKRAGALAIALASRLRPIARIRGKLETAHQSLGELTSPRNFLIGLAYSGVAWPLQCVALNVFAWAYPDVTLSLQAGLLAYAGPLLAGTAALVPGGLGVTELSMTGALEGLGGPGATPAVAASVTILLRLTSFWLAVAIGFCALAIWRYRIASIRTSMPK